MNRFINSAIAGALMAVAPLALAEFDLDQTQLVFDDPVVLTEQLQSLEQAHGRDKARRVIENLGIFIAEHLDQATGGELDESLTFDEKVAILEDHHAEAMKRLEGISYNELERQAKPGREEFYEERRRRAIEKLPEMEAEKRELKAVEAVHDAITMTPAQINIEQDQFGYPKVSLRVDVTNDSEHAFERLSLKAPRIGGIPFHVRFDDQPLAPGQTRAQDYEIDPTHPAARAWIERGEEAVTLTLKEARTSQGDIYDFTNPWSEEQENTLQGVREYADYKSDS